MKHRYSPGRILVLLGIVIILSVTMRACAPLPAQHPIYSMVAQVPAAVPR